MSSMASASNEKSHTSNRTCGSLIIVSELTESLNLVAADLFIDGVNLSSRGKIARDESKRLACEFRNSRSTITSRWLIVLQRDRLNRLVTTGILTQQPVS